MSTRSAGHMFWQVRGPKRRLTNTGVNIRPIPPIMSLILPVVTSHGQENQLWKSRPVS